MYRQLTIFPKKLLDLKHVFRQKCLENKSVTDLKCVNM